MIFGTYAQDEEYLWKKFRAPQFDPCTGIDQDTAAKEIMRFAELDAPAPIIKARAFEFLTENLQIEVDPHDFFPAFACWKRRPCPMSPLLAELRKRIPLQQRELWGLLNQSGASNIWVLPVFRKKIKFHSLPWHRGSSGSGRSSPPYFGNVLPARTFTA